MSSARAGGVVVWMLALGAALTSLSGCRTQTTGREPIVRTEPPPVYSVVASVHNDRVLQLDRLWARTVVVIRYVDEDGRRRSEQGEGHLLLVRPDRVAMTIGSRGLGQTMVHLGCNAERYWWIDLYEGERAWVGRHDGPAAERSGPDGLVLQPRDLIALLGITPLPETLPAGGTWRWSDDGWTVRADLPPGSVSGVRAGERIWFDPETLRPKWIALTDDAGNEMVVSEMDYYQRIPVEGGAGAGPMCPTLIQVWDDADTMELRVRLWSPENKTFNETIFDFEELRQRYRLKDIEDLDAPRDDGAPEGA